MWDGAGVDSDEVIPAEIDLTKVADVGSVTAGNPIGFVLTITSKGPGAAHGVRVNDTLPTKAGLDWSIASQGAGWGDSCAIAAGVLTRPAAFLACGEMAVAYFKVHSARGFWPIQNGGEKAVLYCFVFLFIAAYGNGRAGELKGRES